MWGFMEHRSPRFARSPDLRGAFAHAFGGMLLFFGAAAVHPATGPVAPLEADLKSAYCLPILTLNKTTLEALEYNEPALERGRQSAIRVAETGIRRLERYLDGRAKVVDQAALIAASGRGVADYKLMLTAAESCSAQCMPGSSRTAQEAARCSIDCQAAKEPAVARANECRSVDWLP